MNRQMMQTDPTNSIDLLVNISSEWTAIIGVDNE